MKAVLDHIGIAVVDLEKALGFYRDTGHLWVAGNSRYETRYNG